MKPVTTPTILQMEATECGAAALGIILSYYDLHIPLERLRTACGISRDGSKAVNILKAARNYGMQAQGVSTDLDGLSELKMPVILFWKFNHFIVLEGIKDNTFYINDPGSGRRRINLETFSNDYTGVALSIEPGKDFRPAGIAQSPVASLSQRVQHAKPALSFVVLASLFLLIPAIVLPAFYKIFVDDILIRGMNQWIMPLLLGMLVLAILQSILSYLQQQHLLRLQIKLMLEGSARFIWHILHLPIVFFQQRFAGDINDRISANDRVADLLSTELSASLIGIFSTVVFAIILLLFSWQLSLIGITAAVLNMGLLFFISRKIADTSRRFLQDQGKLAGIEVNAIQTIETLKSQANEAEFFQRWSGQHANIIDAQQKIAIYNQTLLTLPNLVNGLSSTAILGVGAWLIMQGQLTIGTLIAFQSLLLNFSKPLSVLLNMGNKLQQIRGDITRLDDVLQYQEAPRFKHTDFSAFANDEKAIAVDIKQLSFGYSPLDPPLFSDFSLNIAPGSTVAIVGKSGSGKSSLAKLICGLYQPWQGTISFNDCPLDSISPTALSETLAFVDQDIFLFAGTVRDNLTLWDKTLPEAILDKALRDAKIDDIVNARHGLESDVLEGGRNFSGGQRQRLEIARALAKQPSFMILDEATSSLDTIVEKQIFDNLKHYACTKLLITHRLSAIRDSDVIVVLDKGRIIEQGRHEDLIQSQGHYYQLINA